MASNPNNNFPSWGQSGSSPPNGFSYDAGDQVNEKHLDYLWNELNSLASDIEAKWNAVDSNEDDIVSDAENVTGTYKGNDIDSNGDGKVDSADSADSATDATNVTSTYKGNDIDSDGDGKVDNADQLDGLDSSAFIQEESWYFNFYSSGDLSQGDDSKFARAYNVDFPNMAKNNQVFEVVGTGDADGSEVQLVDETNSNVIASVSSTSTSSVRLTDTTWNNPSSVVDVGVTISAGTDDFLPTSLSVSST